MVSNSVMTDDRIVTIKQIYPKARSLFGHSASRGDAEPICFKNYACRWAIFIIKRCVTSGLLLLANVGRGRLVRDEDIRSWCSCRYALARVKAIDTQSLNRYAISNNRETAKYIYSINGSDRHNRFRNF